MSIYIWAYAKTPLTSFDRKGDHLIRTQVHTRCIPDAYPDVVIMFALQAYWRTPIS